MNYSIVANSHVKSKLLILWCSYNRKGEGVIGNFLTMRGLRPGTGMLTLERPSCGCFFAGELTLPLVVTPMVHVRQFAKVPNFGIFDRICFHNSTCFELRLASLGYTISDNNKRAATS
jgi:hypothetical protein